MPENLENESLTPNPTPEPQVETPEGAGTPEPEKHVPLSELLEERHSRQELQQRVEQLTNAQIQLQQHILAMQQQPKGNEPALDPEISKLLDPYLAPYKQQLAQTQAAAQAARDALEAQQKMDYVKANLPELDSIGPEIAKEVQSMDPQDRDLFLSNPRAIVRLGKAILAEKRSSVSASAKAAARNAGRTESSTTSTAAAADNVTDQTDWGKLSSEDFLSQAAARGIRF